MTKYLTTTEAGEIMGCCRKTVEAMIKDGRLRAYRPFGPRGHYAIPEDSIRELMAKNACFYRDREILRKKRA